MQTNLHNQSPHTHKQASHSVITFVYQAIVIVACSRQYKEIPDFFLLFWHVFPLPPTQKINWNRKGQVVGFFFVIFLMKFQNISNMTWMRFFHLSLSEVILVLFLACTLFPLSFFKQGKKPLPLIEMKHNPVEVLCITCN